MKHKTFRTTTRSSTGFFRPRQAPPVADLSGSLQGLLHRLTHELRVAIQTVETAILRSPSALVTTRYGLLAETRTHVLNEGSSSNPNPTKQQR